MFNIGDKLTEENYADGAIWCNENNAVINPDTWTIEAIPEPTAKELAQEKIAELKAQLVASDYVALKMSEAIALNDAELLGLLKVKYKDKLEERQAIRNQIDELEEIVNGGI